MHKRKSYNNNKDNLSNLSNLPNLPNDSKCYLTNNVISDKVNYDSCYLYDNYHDLATCNQIMMIDNHIYFNAIINNETISKLQEYINNIYSVYITNNTIYISKKQSDFKTIYLHINSKGGILSSILPFLNLKKALNIEIVSIIERECNDAAILLASLCNYRIIKKNAECKLSSYTDKLQHKNLPYFWDYFKQCNNNDREITEFKNLLYTLFCNTIDSKITIDKLDKYLNQNNIWNSKKYKKIGLADEII